jgi:hypothetical protein
MNNNLLTETTSATTQAIKSTKMKRFSNASNLVSDPNVAYRDFTNSGITHHTSNNDESDASNWLDVDRFYLQTTQQDELIGITHNNSGGDSSSDHETTISSTGSVARCEHYTANRHFNGVNTSGEICEPDTSPKSSHGYYSYEVEEQRHHTHNYDHDTISLPMDSCLLFATYNSADHEPHRDDLEHDDHHHHHHHQARYVSSMKQSVQIAVHSAIVAKSTPIDRNVIEKKPSRLTRPTINCSTNVKKFVNKFVKKLRPVKKATIKSKASDTTPICKRPVNPLAPKKQHVGLRTHQIPQQPHHKNKHSSNLCHNLASLETPKRKADRILYFPKSQPGQFASNNYELDNIFDSKNSNNQFNTLGDIVIHYI